ncbi:MAG TPA: Na+/H+ antiporter NhaA [Myxococcota bacterium]
MKKFFAQFLAIEAASSLLLVLATIAALVWANSAWGDSYARFWHLKLGFDFAGVEARLSLEHWVNDGLMVIFFFLIGMELKHELVDGELSSRERAMLPIFGALGGMLVPAAIYASLHAGGPAISGWGVPMATDIAFAVAALAIFGRRVPPGLKVFLLALAIVDDLGAVTVIAVFYTANLSYGALAAAGALLVLLAGLRRAGVRSYPVYVLAGIAIWIPMLASGVHATVAGVLIGLLTPTRVEGRAPGTSFSPIEQLTKLLHPWSAFVVMPVFALANAGLVLEAGVIRDPVAFRVTLAVALGLLVGKPLGITLLSWLAVRAGLATLPPGVGWGSLLGAGILGGIGFTMALFITSLAFADEVLAAASKLGVIAASLAAALLGIACLSRALPRGG